MLVEAKDKVFAVILESFDGEAPRRKVFSESAARFYTGCERCRTMQSEDTAPECV